MIRPLRINLAGGWYHVTARGNNRQAIYEDDRGRLHFIDLIGAMVERYLSAHACVRADDQPLSPAARDAGNECKPGRPMAEREL